MALQAIGDGVEEIGDGHAGDERQDDAAQEIEDNRQADKDDDPKKNAPVAAHGVRVSAVDC